MEKEALLSSLRIKGYNEVIVAAFERVRREKFVPQNLIGFAYDDIALPIEAGSTISQPSTIAFMLDLLDIKENGKILEIGSGSGYVLALIDSIMSNGEIYGLEIIQKLAVKSSSMLLDSERIKIFCKEGSEGLPKFAPFDRILVSASCPDMRVPSNLAEQLKDEGVLVAAVGQSIIQLKKQNGKIQQKEFPGFSFIPLRKEG
jgi:protein-L-isoaspartate(D-aspartate) O-methyltransferase